MLVTRKIYAEADEGIESQGMRLSVLRGLCLELLRLAK